MAIAIPSIPVPSQTVLTLRSNAITLTPTMGGPVQRIARPGDKWNLTVTAQAMSYMQAVAIVSALVQGTANKVLSPVPQPGMTIGSPGSPVLVSGAGTSIGVSGFSSGYSIHNGQIFSLVHAGIRYLHQVTADATATGGSATLSIFPMLKIVPSAGDVLEFSPPKIEGFLDSPTQGWSVGIVQTVGLTFSITEAQ
jgi:hypothetical protein